MGLQINNGVQPETGLINNLYTKAQDYASKLLKSDALDFAQYLEKNYDSIDKNKDTELSKNEIAAASVSNRRDDELKKILENNNIDDLTQKIDKNQDGKITHEETNPNSNVPDILKSALREIQTTKDFGVTAQNLAMNMCKNYYTNATMTTLAGNAVSCLL